MAPLRSLGALASLLVLLALAGCGGHRDRGAETLPSGPIAHSEANARTRIVVGAGGRPEQRILAEIDARGLRAAGFAVRVERGFRGPRQALAAISKGRIDVYPDFADLTLDGLGSPEGRPTLARIQTRLAGRNAVVMPGAVAARSFGVAVTRVRRQLLGMGDAYGTSLQGAAEEEA